MHGRQARQQAAHSGGRRQIRCLLRLVRCAEAIGGRERARLDFARHLPRLHARRAVRVAAEDPSDELLPVRLRELHQPTLLERRPRPLFDRRGRALTVEFYKRNYIEGLFLSSGVIRSPDHTMEQLIRVAKTLRRDHGFQGYIHIKAIPQASPWLIEQAGLWTDRLSINLELPTAESLERLAPEKDGGSIA